MTVGEFVDMSKNTLPRVGTLDEPVWAECDRLDVRRRGDRREDDVARRHHGRRVRGPRRARREVCRGALLTDVVDNQVVTTLLQVIRKVLPHCAEADESDADSSSFDIAPLMSVPSRRWE